MWKRVAWSKSTDVSEDPAASLIIRLIRGNVCIWIIWRFYYDRNSTLVGRITMLSLRKAAHLHPDLQHKYAAIIENVPNTLRVDGVKTESAWMLIMYLNHLPLRSQRTPKFYPFLWNTARTMGSSSRFLILVHCVIWRRWSCFIEPS